MKEGGGAEGECERERALGVLLCYSCQSDFALQAVVECRALEPECLDVCVYYVCVYYCRTFYKAVRVGEEESGGHVL